LAWPPNLIWAMDHIKSYRKTDEQLEALLRESAYWAVRGQQGQTLGVARSLEAAVERAAVYAASGAVVVDLAKLPFANIILFADQIDRLRQVIMPERADLKVSSE
jgi:hypothetical protein